VPSKTTIPIQWSARHLEPTPRPISIWTPSYSPFDQNLDRSTDPISAMSSSRPGPGPPKLHILRPPIQFPSTHLRIAGRPSPHESRTGNNCSEHDNLDKLTDSGNPPPVSATKKPTESAAHGRLRYKKSLNPPQHFHVTRRSCTPAFTALNTKSLPLWPAIMQIRLALPITNRSQHRSVSPSDNRTTSTASTLDSCKFEQPVKIRIPPCCPCR